MSPAETAETIKLPFAFRTPVGPNEPRGSDANMGKGNFEGETGKPLSSIWTSAVMFENTAEPIEVPFALWAGIGPKHRVTSAVQIT